MSRLVLHRRAAKYLGSLPKPQKERVKTALQQLANAPTVYPGLIHMAGEWSGYFRIRIGQIRVIFWLDDMADIIYVDYIGSRGDVYKR